MREVCSLWSGNFVTGRKKILFYEIKECVEVLCINLIIHSHFIFHNTFFSISKFALWLCLRECKSINVRWNKLNFVTYWNYNGTGKSFSSQFLWQFPTLHHWVIPQQAAARVFWWPSLVSWWRWNIGDDRQILIYLKISPKNSDGACFNQYFNNQKSWKVESQRKWQLSRNKDFRLHLFRLYEFYFAPGILLLYFVWETDFITKKYFQLAFISSTK